MKKIKFVAVLAAALTMGFVLTSCDELMDTLTQNNDGNSENNKNQIVTSQAAKDMVGILIAKEYTKWYEGEGDESYVVPIEDGLVLVVNSSNTITLGDTTYYLGDLLSEVNDDNTYEAGDLESYVSRYNLNPKVEVFDSTNTKVGFLQVNISYPDAGPNIATVCLEINGDTRYYSRYSYEEFF